MDRHFLIPVSVAAALHAGLLWVPGAPAKTPVAPPTATTVFDAFEFLVSLELTPPEPSSDSAPSSAASSAAPTLPEILSDPILATFTIKVPETANVVVTTPTSTLPLGSVGPETIGDLGNGLPRRDGPINFGDLDNSPRTRSQTSPVYPFEAKRDGREGRVTVEFNVDETGAVVAPHVVESTDRVFDEAALRAVAKWRFEPGRRAGRVVAFRMAVPILFNLNRD